MEQSKAERRSSKRIKLNMLVQFRLANMTQFLEKYANNISLGGIFISSTTPHSKGSKIYLQFYLEDGQKLIEGLGEVVHVNPPDSANPGMGVEFINLDKNSRELIEQIIYYDE